MNKHVRAGAILAGFGLIWGTTVQAEESGAYFGLSGGLTTTSASANDITRNVVNGFAAELADQGLILAAATANSDLDDSDKGWGVHIGYRFNRFVAMEVGYVDLGTFVYRSDMVLTVDDGVGGLPPTPFDTGAEQRLTTQGPFASLLGMFAIGDSFDIHARGGLLFAETRARARSIVEDDPDTFVSIERDDNSTDVFGGIGASWHINERYSVRFEYQKFLDVGGDRTSENDFDYINVAVLFR